MYRTLLPLVYWELEESVKIHTVQITHNLNGPRMSHACDTCGVNHTRMDFLGSTRMYTHTQHLRSRVFLHVCMLVWLM